MLSAKRDTGGGARRKKAREKFAAFIASEPLK
jgi:hypothetical protein